MSILGIGEWRGHAKSACIANDESTAERSIILYPGHATRATLRIIWYSLTRCAIVKKAIYWLPKRILIDGC
jgi:hypothetical protein